MSRVFAILLAVCLMPTAALADSKSYSWVDQRAGDCHLTGALTLNSDGSANFAANSSTDSTHSGDVWHESISVFTAQHQLLFRFGIWNSPRMDDGGAAYTWSANGSYPAPFYGLAATAESSGSC
jgi:hypothetical protein